MVLSLARRKGEAQFIRFLCLSCHGGVQKSGGLARKRMTAERSSKQKSGPTRWRHYRQNDRRRCRCAARYLRSLSAMGQGAMRSLRTTFQDRDVAARFSDELFEDSLCKGMKSRVAASCVSHPDDVENLWFPTLDQSMEVGKVEFEGPGKFRVLFLINTKTAVHSFLCAPNGLLGSQRSKHRGAKLAPKDE